MKIDVCYNCTRWDYEYAGADPNAEFVQCQVRRFQSPECLRHHPQCPFFDMKDDGKFAPKIEVSLTWQDLWQGGFDMTE